VIHDAITGINIICYITTTLVACDVYLRWWDRRKL
jgi:hypothetical protein